MSGASQAAPSLVALLLVFACLSAVYLPFLPHALPFGDDWMVLQMFHHERSAGPLHALAFVRYMVDNTWWHQFRFFWFSWAHVYAVSFLADFAGWPYSLLAWTAHLLTAVLLYRVVSLLAGETWTGFAAAAVFSAFPVGGHVILTPMPIYFCALLWFTLWFYLTWKKLAVSNDFRYRWKDLALALPVLFTSEQNLPLVVLLLPLSFRLWGPSDRRRAFVRYWATHTTVIAAVLAGYVLFVNRVPVLDTAHSRFASGSRWNLRAAENQLSASVGLFPEFAGWRPLWRIDVALVVLLGLAAIACFYAFRMTSGERPGSSVVRLLIWSGAAAILCYLPVARLITLEMRYLYIPCAFLTVAGVVVLSLAGRRVGGALVFLFIAYSLWYTHQEVWQCWIPQADTGHAVLETAKRAAPLAPGEILIFSGDPRRVGLAGRFVTGTSWSLRGMLERYAQPQGDFEAGSDLVINEHGVPAIHRSDSLAWLRREDLGRVRVFAREDDGRWVARSVLAVPAAGGRYELVAIRPLPEHPLPAGPLTPDEIHRLPFAGEIYFVRRIDANTRLWEI